MILGSNLIVSAFNGEAEKVVQIIAKDKSQKHFDMRVTPGIDLTI
jgi:hypothetical protein